jgi:hypothetical protein
MRFWTDGLISKWGFDDGDQLSDYCYDLSEEGVKVEDHDLLIAVVKRKILPALDQHLDLEVISTIHNPIRATHVDGLDVRSAHYEPDFPSPITPEFVDVPEEVIRALAVELSAVSASPSAYTQPSESAEEDS